MQHRNDMYLVKNLGMGFSTGMKIVSMDTEMGGEGERSRTSDLGQSI